MLILFVTHSGNQIFGMVLTYDQQNKFGYLHLYCPFLYSSQMLNKSINFQVIVIVLYFQGVTHGFWMWKTENNNQNQNQDNKQTFRGGDGFCQGKKASLPHLYNSDFVEAMENEVEFKIGTFCLT